MMSLEAYVLVNCEAGRSWDIAKAALEMNNVKVAHAVTGEYDVVACIEFGDMNELTDILGKFQTMKGIQKTHTAVAIPPKTN
jgi:DNA-binding Lrp family transcriptional regulator